MLHGPPSCGIYLKQWVLYPEPISGSLCIRSIALSSEFPTLAVWTLTWHSSHAALYWIWHFMFPLSYTLLFVKRQWGASLWINVEGFFPLNTFYLLFILMHQFCFGSYFHSMPFLLATALKCSVSAFQRCEWIWQKMRKEGKRREINHNPPLTSISASPPTHTHSHTYTNTHSYYTGSQISAKVEYGQRPRQKKASYVLGVSYELHISLDPNLEILSLKRQI